MNHTVKLYSLDYSYVRTYWAAGLFVLGNMALPYLFHLIPQGGMTWLPIYFFTLVGAYKCGWRVGLLTAVVSPLLNAALFGMPMPAALPAILLKSVLLALAAGFLAGGVWALIAALFKAKLGISEIIVTIMLNYIAINLIGIAVRTFLMDPSGSVPQSAKIDPSVQLAQILPPTRLHVGFLIAVASVALIWFLLQKTTLGYEIKVVGFNKRAAACNGISVTKNIVISAFLSGGLAGLAGVVEVLAIQKKLLEGISSNCGYTAVLVALLAGNHPVGVMFVAVGMAAMQVGANTMQRQLGVPSAIVDILVGLVVLLILAKGIMRRKKAKKASA